MARCGSRPSGRRSTVTWTRVPRRTGSSCGRRTSRGHRGLRVDVVPGLSADGAVERGIRQGEGLVRLRGSGAAASSGPGGPRRAAAARSPRASRQWTSAPRRAGRPYLPSQAARRRRTRCRRRAGPGVEPAAGQPVGEGCGAVAGVEDEQRRGILAVPGGVQAAQHVPSPARSSAPCGSRARCAGRR